VTPARRPAPAGRAPPPAPAPPESLAGLVERVTFFNEETGFAVLKVKVKKQRDLLTVVGSAAAVNPGEWLHAQGRWVQDREFGRQFRAELLTCTPPTTLEGIEKYLGSGMVKGLGPVHARKLVARFGAAVLDVIEHTSARLEEVDGIGPTRRRRIKAAWAEQRLVRAIMVFLHSHGVSTSRATRIYRTYGEQAIEKVRGNPYLLARDIPGIGFQTADAIARKLGMPPDSLARACAGLDHVLQEATQAGHCALPLELLRGGAARLLSLDDALVTQALERTVRTGDLVRETLEGVEMVFLPHLRRAEEAVALALRRLGQAASTYPPIDQERAIAWCEARTGKQLAPTQAQALRQALTSRLLVITGGPGVGKTTLVNAILLVLRAKRVRCLLAAPTGRAAKRLAEATSGEARTLHRLLEVHPGTGAFTRNEKRPLECDLLVVDECSMVDLPLMHAVLRALPEPAGLLLVGDVDQLPSVGPGSVLQDLIVSGVAPVVRLKEVFRQAASSLIITNAHRVNEGLLPEPPPPTQEADFYLVERNDPGAIASLLLEMVQARIPAKFGLDPRRDIQVLTPMNRGSLGVRELNLALQNALNPAQPDQAAVERFGWQFRVGDKVMQVENNYDKDVFNGDIGQVSRLDLEEQELGVRYDTREVVYEFSELDQLALAYAITIHKSQGSEFPAVVIPVAMQQFVLLERNLLYTGMTRGRRLVVLIAQRQALALAVKNLRTERRCAGLLARLRTAAA
jgi:exodeoxyribonuclease V alpha subunit